MTTITWKNLKTGGSKIEIFRSRDKLNKVLQSLKYDRSKEQYVKEEKVGRTTVQLAIVAMSYEDEDEKAMFRKYGLIPKEEDYLDGNQQKFKNATDQSSKRNA